MEKKPARTRFAPSPTGHLHLGGARTALYDYLLARQTGGQFILRIEDTDQKRVVPGTEQEIMDMLSWMGLKWDEGPDTGGPYGPYRQSERKQIYLDFAEQLVASGQAFYCFCTPERLAEVRREQLRRGEQPHYDGTCRRLSPDEARERAASGEPHVIRFKSPQEGTTKVNDLLRGEIVVENHTIDDYVLIKSDGWALYHLAALVDDHLMDITHVIRGSEWLPSLPLHSLIYRAFGWQEPVWVHLSVFLKPSGKGKMSKRDMAAYGDSGYSIYVKDLMESGYLPEGVVNWIALMGWSYDDHTEFFTLPDLVEKFDLKHLNPSPAAINFSKLDHFDGLHMRALGDQDLASRLKPFFEQRGYRVDDDTLLQIVPLIRERINTLEEGVDIAGFLFQEEVEVHAEDLVAKDLTPTQAIEIGQGAMGLVESLDSFGAGEIETAMRAWAGTTNLSNSQVFGFVRNAIAGQKVTPPLFGMMAIIGKTTVLRRLRHALELLEGPTNPEQNGREAGS